MRATKRVRKTYLQPIEFVEYFQLHTERVESDLAPTYGLSRCWRVVIVVTSTTICGGYRYIYIMWSIATYNRVSRNRGEVCLSIETSQQLGFTDGSKACCRVAIGLTSVRAIWVRQYVLGHSSTPKRNEWAISFPPTFVHQQLCCNVNCYKKRIKNTSRLRRCARDWLLDNRQREHHANVIARTDVVHEEGRR